MTSKTIIDQITYTASLASHPQEIDPLLDPLRFITAKMVDSQGLSTEDLTTLNKVQRSLEDYLLNYEPLRAFTPETLQQKIRQHIYGDSQIKGRRQLRTIIILAVLLSIGGGLAPGINGLPLRIEFAVAIAFSVLHLGAAWFFYSALRTFKSPLRHGFQLITFGVILLGLNLLQQPFMEFFHLRTNPIMSIVFPLPLLLAASCFHDGDRIYSKLIGVQSRLISLKPVFVAAVVMAIFTLLLPQPSWVSEPPFFFKMGGLLNGWVMLTPLASFVILAKAARQAPALYRRATKALFQSMFAIIGVTSYVYIAGLLTGTLIGPSTYVAFGFLIIEGSMLIRAGYAFSQAESY